MKSDNPFFLSFGIKPDNYISRITQTEEVVSAIENNNPNNNAFVITGVRGCGKTALLCDISEYFEKKTDWVTIELLTNMDMLEQLASRLYDMGLSRFKFLDKSFSLSYSGLTFSISGNTPVSNILTLIESLLDRLQKKNLKLLVCIDEMLKNGFTTVFAQAFQLLSRKKYPIKIIMTGLFSNIYELENDKSLTFLLRAPKIRLEPLNINAIAAEYEKIFSTNQNEALKLAKITKGYAYCYQVLGYLAWENDKNFDDPKVYQMLDQYLQEYSYEKIWSELSPKDRQVLLAFDSDKPNNVSALTTRAETDKKTFSVYRDRLIKRGLITSEGYGKLSLALPRFFEFLRAMQ